MVLTYEYAVRALSDGGFNSPTYRKYADTNYDTAITRIRDLYRIYAYGQSVLGWPAFTEPWRSHACSATLHLQRGFDTSTPHYRAYYEYHNLHTEWLAPKPSSVHYPKSFLDNLKDINIYLYNYVLNV